MLILASASPRRQELLRLLGEEFRVIPADIDESVREHVALHRIPAPISQTERLRMSAPVIPGISCSAATRACLSTIR